MNSEKIVSHHNCYSELAGNREFWEHHPKVLRTSTGVCVECLFRSGHRVKAPGPWQSEVYFVLVCVFITAVPITKLFAGGEGAVLL